MFKLIYVTIYNMTKERKMLDDMNVIKQYDSSDVFCGVLNIPEAPRYGVDSRRCESASILRIS